MSLCVCVCLCMFMEHNNNTQLGSVSWAPSAAWISAVSIHSPRMFPNLLQLIPQLGNNDVYPIWAVMQISPYWAIMKFYPTIG